MQRWELDGFVITETEGFWVVDGIDRLPPGWYTVQVGYDEGRETPTLAVTPVEVAVDLAHGDDTFAVTSLPNADTRLIQVMR